MIFRESKKRKHKTKVSLRGGTTKQSAAFNTKFFLKINDYRLNFTNYILRSVTGCFVVPPRNDTLILRKTLQLNFKLHTIRLIFHNHIQIMGIGKKQS